MSRSRSDLVAFSSARRVTWVAYALFVVAFASILLRDEAGTARVVVVALVAAFLVPVALRFSKLGTFRSARGTLVVVNPLRTYELGPGDIAEIVPDRPRWGPIRIELTDGTRLPIVHAPPPWSPNRAALYAFVRGL